MRYVLTQPAAVQQRFRTINGLAASDKPNYNIRPGLVKTAFVARSPIGGDELKIGLLGMMPPWANSGSREVLAIARSEEIETKPMFRDAFAATRCLIPTDGFFVWEEKQPYFVRLKSGQLFAVAGIYSVNAHFQPPLTSFAALTTFPNTLIAQVQTRMPVMLLPENEEFYLDPATPLDDVKKMMLPVDEDDVGMEMYPVTPRLNGAKYSTRDFVRPYDELVSEAESRSQTQTGQLKLID